MKNPSTTIVNRPERSQEHIKGIRTFMLMLLFLLAAAALGSCTTIDNYVQPEDECQGGEVYVTLHTTVLSSDDTGLVDDSGEETDTSSDDCDLSFTSSLTAFTGDLLRVTVVGESGTPSAWTEADEGSQADPWPLTQVEGDCDPLWQGRVGDGTMLVRGVIHSENPEPDEDCSSKVRPATVYGLSRTCELQLTSPEGPFLWLGEEEQLDGACICQEDGQEDGEIGRHVEKTGENDCRTSLGPFRDGGSSDAEKQ